MVHGFPPFMRWTILGCLVVWFLQAASWERWAPGWSWLTLTPSGLLHGRVWTLLTYQYLHDPRGPFHLLFNMLNLWFFGRDLEHRWGTWGFARFYLACGVGGGALYTLVSLVLGQDAPLVGASGSVLGVLMAFGLVWPRRVIALWGLLRIEARYLVLFIALIDLMIAWAGTWVGSASGAIAHVGGMATGWLYVKQAWWLQSLPGRLRAAFDDWRRSRRRSRMKVVDRDWDRWLDDNDPDDRETRH